MRTTLYRARENVNAATITRPALETVGTTDKTHPAGTVSDPVAWVLIPGSVPAC